MNPFYTYLTYADQKKYAKLIDFDKTAFIPKSWGHIKLWVIIDEHLSVE